MGRSARHWRAPWAWLLACLPLAAVADADQLVTTVCAACHGADGNGGAVPGVPRLAGLQAAYISKQLKDYLGGKRKSDLMSAVVASLDESDVPGLAAYYARQKPAPAQVREPALVGAGKAMFDDGNVDTGVPACVGCHQEGAVGNERNPRIAGQHPDYAIEQMKQFRNGTRSNDRNKAMRIVAERMTDDEVRAVAEYLAGL